MEQAEFVFPHDVQEIVALAEHGIFEGYPDVMQKVFKYLSAFSTRGAKPNVEVGLNARFKRVQARNDKSRLQFEPDDDIEKAR